VIQDGPAYAGRVHHQRCTRQLLGQGRDALDYLRVRRAERETFEVADVNVVGHRLGHGNGGRVLGLAEIDADDASRQLLESSARG
jgi:hypothetical protein